MYALFCIHKRDGRKYRKYLTRTNFYDVSTFVCVCVRVFMSVDGGSRVVATTMFTFSTLLLLQKFIENVCRRTHAHTHSHTVRNWSGVRKALSHFNDSNKCKSSSLRS